jgi:cytochrome b6-f complex iron-sulfur subunit
MSRLDPPPINRRSFLSLASMMSFFAAVGTAAAGIFRLPDPAVLPGPVRRFKLGPPEQFSVGTETAFAEQNLVLFRDNDGFYAISSTCTHLGCTVARSKEGFACPCHGSRFDRKGDVIGGPAPRALPWLEVSRAANGDLVVNADNEVAAGTRYRA